MKAHRILFALIGQILVIQASADALSSVKEGHVLVSPCCNNLAGPQSLIPSTWKLQGTKIFHNDCCEHIGELVTSDVLLDAHTIFI